MSAENAFNRLKREIGIKKCLILEGNIGDVFLYEKRIRSLKECLRSALEDVGYTDIVFWDMVSGIEGDVDRLKLVDDVNDSAGEDSGDEYDFGDHPIPETSATGSCRDPGDIFALIRRTMGDPSQKAVFVLDWSEYVFSAGQLDPNDREYLTIFGKSLRDAELKYNKEEPKTGAVIFITSKVSMIPLSVYSGNPEVSVITLTKPDMQERRDLLRKISSGFDLKDDSDISASDRFEDYVDMLNDFTSREIIQMANLSRTESQSGGQREKLTFEKLYYLFRYGEKENPWEKLDPDKVRRISPILSERVIGQEQAIRHIEDTIVKAFMGITGIHKSSSRSMPKGVFFFVGPTGVGKTELSKSLAKFLFGDESACIRFDMSEYAQPNSDQKLIGAPPGYVGFEEGGQLTNAIREKPFSVVLFDEIEKAAKPNPRILDIFLQILEDGRLTDNRGETTYFSDTVIIFTSNLGAADVVNTGDNERAREEFIRIVKDYFDNELKRPEILGRIGYSNIVPFNFINDPSFAGNILKSKIKPVQISLKEKYGMELEIENEKEFLNYILKGADTAKGGRDILNALDSRLLTPLSKWLFRNYNDLEKFEECALIAGVDSKNDELVFEIEE